MAIDLFVAGDPASCYACGRALTGVSQDVDGGVGKFITAKSNSESHWGGTAGDSFRSRVGAMSKGAGAIGDHTASAAKAVNTLGDDLTTVKARMRQAAEHASAAGLKVTPSLGDPTSIEAPSHRMGPVTGAEAADYAKKVAAYNESISMVVAARGLEKTAHATLKQSLSGLQMLVDDAKKQWGWLLANTVNGYVGTAVSQSEKWKSVANAAKQKADACQKAADAAEATGDPFWESKTAHELKVAGADADDAAKTFASNAKLVGGHTENMLAKAAAGNFGELAADGSKLSKFGEKVPYVGTGLALGQTGFDVYNDRHEGAGTIARDVGRDAGGFIAGTAATELILASSAGGPATMGEVAVGVGVAYGVGEVVDHWDGISHGVGTAAKWVGDLF